MNGHKNQSGPSSVQAAALKLLADLDEQHFAWDEANPQEAATARSIEALRLALQSERSVILDIENPQLAEEGVQLIRTGAPPSELTPDHVRAIVDAAEAALANEASGQLRWDATLRAIERWQAAEPDKPVWELIDAARALAKEAEDRNTAASRRVLKAIEAMPSAQGPRRHDLIWPDHADLLVWLLELVEHQPACPALKAVESMIELLEYPSGLISTPVMTAEIKRTAAETIRQLANALIASSRRTVEAESNAMIIPRLIAAWVRVEGMGAGTRLADGIEAGEWLPLRGAAIRAERANRPHLQLVGEPIEGPVFELQSGCELSIMAADAPMDPVAGAKSYAAPRVYDSLRTVLLRPDVGEAFAKGLCHHNGGDWENATEGGRQAFRLEARHMIEEALAAPR